MDTNERARRLYEREGWRDAGAFLDPVATGSGTVFVPAHRYERSTTR